MRRREFMIGTAAMLLAGSGGGALGAARSGAERSLSAQARFSSGLVQALAKARGAGQNVLGSPAGAASILGLLASEADERMRRAIHRTLQFDGSDPGPDLDHLRAARPAVSGDGATFTLANALALDPSSRANEDALARLRAAGAEVFVEPLSAPATVRRINGWVSGKTNGLIPEVLAAPPQNAGLVALNALYFKGLWRTQFDPALTRHRPFTRLAGGATAVPMMTREGSEAYREDDRFIAVDLPYRNERFSLVVVTTKEQPAPAADLVKTVDWLTGAGFERTRMDLQLPRFTLREGAEILPVLDGMGLKEARNAPDAFARLTPVPQRITQARQEVFVRVDEEGTEAAAATSVITTRMARPRSVRVVIDKPFVFALRDKTSGLVLVTGYVGDPTAGAVASARNGAAGQ
jgi:serpin B